MLCPRELDVLQLSERSLTGPRAMAGLWSGQPSCIQAAFRGQRQGRIPEEAEKHAPSPLGGVGTQWGGVEAQSRPRVPESRNPCPGPHPSLESLELVLSAVLLSGVTFSGLFILPQLEMFNFLSFESLSFD